jgi:16S rRNA (guanine527-N7)-methyltransferase
MSKSEFIRHYPVPHETLYKLSEYVEILLKWNSKINLISKNSENDIWIRHILDSVQIEKFIKKNQKILDVGSGAGFPGIVLGIMGFTNVTLIDSDQRKCSFLLEVIRLLKLDVVVINDRIENIHDKSFDVITARGFASIEKVLRDIDSIRRDRVLLLKGKNYQLEIHQALQKWDFECITYYSITDFSSHIVDISNVQKK